MVEGSLKIVVLRAGVHGIAPDEYVDEIQARIEGPDVVLARTPQEERELISDAEIVTAPTITDEHLDHAQDLRLYASTSSGTDAHPMDRLEEMDVAVTNASGVFGPNIAEQVLGWILTFTRNLHEGIRRQRKREYRHFRAHELKGGTVTIVGLGDIGQSVAQRLDGFDVTTIGVRHTPSKGGPTDEVVGYEAGAIHDALSRSDYVVLACPLTDLTEGLIGWEELQTLPPRAVVINVARGPIVDTDDLVTAIQRNAIRGAALDATDPSPLPPDHVLWTFDNVLVTPHMSGHTPAFWSRCARILSRNVETIQRTGQYTDLENQVLTPGN